MALLAEIHRVLGRWLRGQLLLIVLVAAVVYVILGPIMGLRYALAIGILTGILEIIPLVGPILAAGIAAVDAVAQGGLSTAALVIVIYTVLRQIEDQLVAPWVIGRAVHLHPIVTILAVLIGLEVYGVLGGLLGVPAAAAINVVFRALYPQGVEGVEETFAGAGRCSRRAAAAPGGRSRGSGRRATRRGRATHRGPPRAPRRPNPPTSRPGRPTDVAAATPARSRRATARLILILGSLSAFAPLSIDMYLPALPALAADLHGSASEVQLTLTACFVGLALGQIVAGPLSDAYGRRRPMLVGLAAFARRLAAVCRVAERGDPHRACASSRGRPARPASSSPAPSCATCSRARSWPGSMR